jgi:putative endonuclease
MTGMAVEKTARSGRALRGQVGYHAGMAAEDAVARHYAMSGRPIAATRWRGSAGEIDLVAREGNVVVFIEVKKSSSHVRAAERLTQRQMARIYNAASEFLATEPTGQMTESRFDVALVDAMGRIEIVENAFAA